MAVPTLLRIQNEGTTANDGYFAIDDITLTVDNAISLDTTFTDGFESYAVGNSTVTMTDPWITVASHGTWQRQVVGSRRKCRWWTAAR